MSQSPLNESKGSYITPSNSLPPPPPPREEQNARSFIEVGLHGPPTPGGPGGAPLRESGGWTRSNITLLGMSWALGKVGGEARRQAMSALDRRDEFYAFIWLQSAPCPEVARAVRAFCRRKDATDRDTAWEELITQTVEPWMFAQPMFMEGEALAKLAETSELEAAAVEASKPDGRTNRPAPPPDPNGSGQDGSPHA
jgi:hypothetical protein